MPEAQGCPRSCTQFASRLLSYHCGSCTGPDYTGLSCTGPDYHPRSGQLVLADNTVHEFLTGRKSNHLWVVSARVSKKFNPGPPVHYVTCRGRRVLQWQVP